ncbi:response regulator [Chryseobacterium sp. JV274]|uniref:response regulator n=1 Tax=Chryseobacterium sp. JV274 TaxID=1932669 RepID=UPI0015C204B4|nr:response regulator [Chryseobacterium sp. JV274]CAD0218266.1 Response regulator receiver domain-containing protein [Chryseobacterium sp. JV274]
MKCIIVNDDSEMRKTIGKLIGHSRGMKLLSVFNSTSEAALFLRDNCVDLVFFDIQMYDVKNLEFIQNISERTFVIYIPEFSPFVNTTKKPQLEQLSESTIAKRFKKGVDEARIFLKLIKKEKPDILDDYFVI